MSRCRAVGRGRSRPLAPWRAVTAADRPRLLSLAARGRGAVAAAAAASPIRTGTHLPSGPWRWIAAVLSSAKKRNASPSRSGSASVLSVIVQHR